MSEASPQQKGDAFEDAVRAIETTILEAAPGYAEGTFRIQGKRLVISDGVKHEIDIYVTASLPHGYESVFIFE